MSISSEVVIVGAGIVGTAIARALARDGFKVLIIEARSVGSGATAAGMGHIVIMDDSPAQLALTRYSQQLWNELYPQLPADCEVDHCGTLWIAADDEEIEEVHRKQQVYAEIGLTAEVLDDSQLLDAEPQLRTGLAGGLRIPGDTVIYPPCAARWLLEEAERLGAKSMFGKVVKAMNGHLLTLNDDSKIEAKYVIDATGSWSSRLTPDVPIRAKKGHLVITDRYPGFVHHQLLELGYLKSAHGAEKDSVAFNVQPRKTGQLLIGSSRQYDRDDREVDHDLLQRMLKRAICYLPKLSAVSAIRVWTGIRAATSDSLPLIGPHPTIENLFLATGHEGLGITTSLATAEIVACHLSNRQCEISTDAYIPKRLFPR